MRHISQNDFSPVASAPRARRRALLSLSALAAAAVAWPHAASAAPPPPKAAKPVAAKVTPVKFAAATAPLPSRSVIPAAPAQWDPPNPPVLNPAELVGPFILVDESLPQVIALYENISGKIVLRTQTLPALKINFSSSNRISRADAVTAFETLLSLNSVNIVPVEGTAFCKATLNAFATQDAPPLYTDAAEVAKLPSSERLVSRLYVFKNIPAAYAVTPLTSLVNRVRGDTITFSPLGNAILLVSTVSNIRRAETIFAHLDEPNDVVLYKLQHIGASDLKRQFLALQGGKKPIQTILGGDFTLEADDLSQTVMVITQTANHEKIKRLIEQLDRVNVSLKNYPVKNVRASDLRKTLLSLASAASGIAPGAKPLPGGGVARNVLRNLLLADFVIEADDLSNQLIVITLPENQIKVEELIKSLDKNEAELKFYKLKNLRPTDVKRLVLSLQGTGVAPVKGAPPRLAVGAFVGDFTIEADDNTGQLLVVTRAENHKKITDLIARLDTAQMTLHFYPVKNLRASEIKRIIVSLQTTAVPAAKGAPPKTSPGMLTGDYTLEADDVSNQIIAFALPENQVRLKGLISVLDKNETELKFYKLKNLRPSDMKRLVLSLQAGTAAPPVKGVPPKLATGTFVGDFTIEADDNTGQILVATRAENHKKIEELIARLDTSEALLHFYPIRNLRASEIKRIIVSLQTLAGPPAKGAPPKTPAGLLIGDYTIEADDISNQLVVVTVPGNHKKIAELVEQLDKAKVVHKFYEIKHLRASDVKKFVQNLQNAQVGAPARPGTQQGKDSFRNLVGGDVAMEANDMANTLLVVAHPEAQAKIGEIITEMDTNSSELMVFKIKHLKATKIKRLLDALRTGRSQDGTTPVAANRTPTNTDPNAVRNLLGGDITIEADDFANQLIVVAQPQIREKVRALIGQLDQDNAPQTTSEIIGLKHSEVENTVRALSVIVTGKSGGLVQVEGGARSFARQEAVGGLANVSTGVNAYRTFSFTNRTDVPGASVQQASRTTTSSAGSPRSFSEYVTVSGEERTNRLMIFGTADDLRQLKEIVSKLDVPLPQVRIEAVVVEVSLTTGEASGLDTLGLGYKSVGNVGTIGAPEYNFGASSPNVPGSNSAPFSVTGSLKDFSLSVLFGLAERNSRVRILSAPLINTSHNQPATVFVGEEHPVITSSMTDLSNTTSTRSSITAKPIGLSLSVTPRVGSNGSVEMKVDQSNQSVTRTVLVDNNEQPIISMRSASAYLIANDNETVVLAGLQSYRETETTGVMWLLGSIPLLGRLFRPETSETTRTEIVIFLKPHIFTPGSTKSDSLPGLAPGSLTRPDAKGYIDNGRFSAVSLTDDELAVIEKIRRRHAAASAATRAAQSPPATKKESRTGAGASVSPVPPAPVVPAAPAASAASVAPVSPVPAAPSTGVSPPLAGSPVGTR
ncbi:MAG: hypothetical protein LBT53_02710 [Puniceicoccales bacterium]|jgi:type II secretory pathway component GspD/PulD (secretin)|nr:hypothetical protein [Puniceicoccales bacterium]